MKIKVFLILISLFSMNSAFAEKIQLTEDCKAFLLEDSSHAFAQIEEMQDSIASEINEGGYGNTSDGYFVLASLFSNNPYEGLHLLKNGITRLEKGLSPRKKQVLVMQSYCDNDGELTMELISKK